MNTLDQQYLDLCDPDVLRPRLMKAALFIVAFEMLKDVILERTRPPFDGAPVPTLAEILQGHRSPIYAVLGWLKDHDAITPSDIVAFDQVKACRNHLAHRMLEVMAETGLPGDFDEQFDALITLLRKISAWWVLMFDVPVDPQFDGKEITISDIETGSVMGLQLLCQVALGDPQQSRFYLDEMRKRIISRGQQVE